MASCSMNHLDESAHAPSNFLEVLRKLSASGGGKMYLPNYCLPKLHLVAHQLVLILHPSHQSYFVTTLT